MHPGRLAGAVLVVVLGIGCRREASSTSKSTQPSARPASSVFSDVPRTPRPQGGRAPVFWIGMDGLDWELLDRFAADGTMPNWKRLVSEGSAARLESFIPILSPIVWTTAATGMPPDVHRVLDFQETDPKTGAKVPISGLSRESPAVWNVASAAGRKVGVVGWWATHPAEEVNGFFVSDHASPILFDRLPLRGAAYPPALESGVGRVASLEGAVSNEDLAGFIDAPAAEIAAARASGAGLDNPIVALSRILASTKITHRLARDLYDREHPDLLAVYFEGTDEIGHVFAASTPPRLGCVSEGDFARYQHVVQRYYARVDEILGQWMRRAAEDGASVIIHSDHGFKWGDDRPCRVASGNWATAAFWHRLDGVFLAWGSGVTHSEARLKASVFDLAPTMLALLDLPGDPRMPGKPAAFAFSRLRSSVSARDLSATPVRRVAAEAMTATEASEYARKLMALGYLSGSETRPLAPSGGARPGMTEGAWNNLGLYLRDTAKKPSAARAAFEKSLALRPDYYSPMYNLAVLARSEGRTNEAEDWLLRSLAALKDSPEKAILSWSHEYQDAGNRRAAASLLARAAAQWPANEEIARDLAVLRVRSSECPGALAALGKFESATSDPRTLNTLALVQTCLRNRAEVVRLLERSLTLRPDQPEIARSLSVARGERPPAR